jgi:hypothetical protein
MQTPRGKYEDPRERNRFCIEDPFEIEFNVARCVSKDGLYLVRTPTDSIYSAAY